MSELTLHLLGEMRAIPVDELEPVVSPHTGASLRRFSVQVEVASARSKELQAELAEASRGESFLESSDGSKWRVGNSYSSYQNGVGNPVTHSFELTEGEVLAPTALEFDGMSISPIRYVEDADSAGRITIRARVDLDEEQSARVQESLTAHLWTDDGTDNYFDLVRRGISDEPMRVRLGPYMWQRLESGRAHRLVFLSEHGDYEFRGFSEPELGNVERMAAVHADVIRGLLDELVASGVLSDDARARIEERAEDAYRRRWHDFGEVAQLDAWW